MTTKKIYDPWIKWHGVECPVPPDTKVAVRYRCIAWAACAAITLGVMLRACGGAA